jgi:FtsZ-interacting cell division protein ZipA
MDATTLRWILAIIGVVVIGGIYGYSLWQDRRRRHAAVRSLTREELEAGFIEDDALREELSSLSERIDDKAPVDVDGIRINPGLEAAGTNDTPVPDLSADPDAAETPPAEKTGSDEAVSGNDAAAGETLQLSAHCVAHILRQREDRPLSGDAILLAGERCGLTLDADGFLSPRAAASPAPFRCANLSQSGSFASIHEAAFKTQGLLCWFDTREQAEPLGSYEQMLKTIDELVRELDLKVYNQDLELLTLQHVTDLRHRLKSLNPDDSSHD